MSAFEFDGDLGDPVYDATEVCKLAQNIARNCQYAVFPCHQDKNPATPHGFKDGSTDSHRIAELWRRYPGPLIGVATGEASGNSILDVDVTKGDDARAWWRRNEQRLPITRTYRTRSGGLHLVFQHASGVRNVTGKPIPGIDVRGDGGYFIFWFAAGFECVDHSPPAPWPHWLTAFFWPPEPKRKASEPPSGGSSSAAIAGLIRTVRDAAEKTRNSKLNWAAYHMRKRVDAKEISETEAKRRLLDAAKDCGLPEKEAQRTVKSAWTAS